MGLGLTLPPTPFPAGGLCQEWGLSVPLGRSRMEAAALQEVLPWAVVSVPGSEAASMGKDAWSPAPHRAPETSDLVALHGPNPTQPLTATSCQSLCLSFSPTRGMSLSTRGEACSEDPVDSMIERLRVSLTSSGHSVDASSCHHAGKLTVDTDAPILLGERAVRALPQVWAGPWCSAQQK